MEMLFIRIMGIIMAVGCSALLIALWFSYGVPVSPKDWAACIAINMLFGLMVISGLFMACLKD